MMQQASDPGSRIQVVRHAMHPALQLRVWQLVERQAEHVPPCLEVGKTCQILETS